MKTTTKSAQRLMHEGQRVLAEVSANGIRIDVDRAHKVRDELIEKIERLTERLQQEETWRLWRKIYGDAANIDSNQQLAETLFSLRGHAFDPPKRTRTGKYASDEQTLSTIDLPFVRNALKLRQLKKMRSTYLNGILRETDEHGFLHPWFGLSRARSYRSNSSDPNFQNIPIRDPKLGKLIRPLIVPRPGRVLLEIDYGQIEVRVVACYNKDPNLIEYIKDDYDFHLEYGKRLFFLNDQQISKPIRQEAKGNFTFATFYGSYFKQTAEAMWQSLERTNFQTKENVALLQHLEDHGIKSYASFEKHVERTEQHLWNDSFPVYAAWRKKFFEKYLERGWFRTKTGFVHRGYYRRNEVVNFPIQGSAFHCLLWSIIEMHKWLRRQNFQTLIIGQIHDSILFDVPQQELDALLELALEIMCHRLRKHFSWICVPIVIEAEGSDVNWFEKEEIKLPT